MKFWIFTLLLIFYPNFSTADYADDLARVLKAYRFDKECAFNYTQVDSKTLKEFPKCEMVFGVLVFNEKTDLTVKQMKQYFKNMTVLVGGFVVENTKFENLNFFTEPEYFLDVYGDKFGVFIRNNTRLNDYKMLNILFLRMDKNGKETKFEVVNNPELNAKDLCQSSIFHYSTDLRVKGNLKDCGCNGDEIHDTTLASFNSCKTSYFGLFLKNMTATDFSSLSSITQIKGVIDISDTNLKDLSFLKNLESFRYRNQDLKPKISFNLQDNPEMMRLRLPTTFHEIHNTEVEEENGPEEGIAIFNFENLHPDFCLTIEEINFFLVSQVAFKTLHSKICKEKEEFVMTENGAKIWCRFDLMNNLDDNCYVILGDVVVDSGDEEYVTKLAETVYIYGSLTVMNTKLKSLDYFSKLKYIVHLGEGPVIQITSNNNLKNPYFESLQSVFAREQRTAIIQDNHPDIFSQYGGNCTLVESDDIYRLYRTDMLFSGGDCGEPIEIVEFNRTSVIIPVKEDNLSRRNSFILAWFGFFVLFNAMAMIFFSR